MIHIKLLSGEVMEVEVSQSITVVELRSRMKHPFPVFFRGERELALADMVNPSDTLSVVFQSYRAYFVWLGGENSVWPGEKDKIFCYDFSAREQVEWRHDLVTDNDALVVDYLSFGLIQPYTSGGIRLFEHRYHKIRDILNVSFLPSDLDFQAVKDCFRWTHRAKQDDRELGFADFIINYGDEVKWVTYVGLFRVSDGKSRTALDWISRITE